MLVLVSLVFSQGMQLRLSCSAPISRSVYSWMTAPHILWALSRTRLDEARLQQRLWHSYDAHLQRVLRYYEVVNYARTKA